jgi:hypothetical protein
MQHDHGNGDTLANLSPTFIHSVSKHAASAADGYSDTDSANSSTYDSYQGSNDDAGVNAVMKCAQKKARSSTDTSFKRALTHTYLGRGAPCLFDFKIEQNPSPIGKQALDAFENVATVQPALDKKLMSMVDKSPTKPEASKAKDKPTDEQIADRMRKALVDRRNAAKHQGTARGRTRVPIDVRSAEQMESFALQIDVNHPGLPSDAKAELVAARLSRTPLRDELQAILQSTLKISNIDISTIAGGRDEEEINKLVRNRRSCVSLLVIESRWNRHGTPRSGPNAKPLSARQKSEVATQTSLGTYVLRSAAATQDSLSFMCPYCFLTMSAENEAEFPISIVYRYDAINVGLSDGQLIISHNCGELLHDSKWIVLLTDTRPMSKVKAKVLAPETDQREDVQETDIEDTEPEHQEESHTANADTDPTNAAQEDTPTSGGSESSPSKKMKLKKSAKKITRTTSLPTMGSQAS